MSATVYQFQKQAWSASDLTRRHMGFCVQDITRIAELILAGRQHDVDRHSAFARDLAAARLYNRLHLPETPFDLTSLFIDACCGITGLFQMELQAAANERPRLRESDPWAREEITQRVLADSSDYIPIVTDFLVSQSAHYRFADYTRPYGALRLLETSGLIRIKNADELATECRTAISAFYSHTPLQTASPPSPRV
ncbi:MAG: hypothetical protein HYS17_00715 [Micavibrio aeruginosavorus]|uniref:Uncharacterized protein n=1 Tax=Micavibrio aeruginosavorus TaxID=349221 RepID=A0A7T5UI60_9BACT|nr:MAG: hypothetical protein HYS17_00715 [Micavibrio aeruginosavorus]